jgi:hypothetical protein
MGNGLKRVAKQCVGLTVRARGCTARYDANGTLYRVTVDDPRTDHDDFDDGEVRCAGCKAILRLDARGVIDHVCPSTGR